MHPLQEYLNYSEHLYGIVTNGRQLRLLRDASRITRLSYVEFDLEKMMEEDLYSDFVIFFRLLHASRMPQRLGAGDDSIIEKFHREGLEAGSTIRNKLGDAVKEAIYNLANGFLNHPDNNELRASVASGKINADEYYHHQLRIIYRLLFLFVIEERNLVYANSNSVETKRFNQIYTNYYSLSRLRRLAKKLQSPDAARHYDLWQSLVSTFSLFEIKEIGRKLGIMSLQGDLFGYDAISNSRYNLHQCFLSNAVLLNIVKSLSYFENDNGILIAVNYGGLDVEEFGSVYEGLLELKLEFDKTAGSENYFVKWKKQENGREFQSHYTPEELVQPLIKHSLEHLIEDRVKPYQLKKATKQDTVESLLNLKICDIACGSGHILLSAARRLSLEVARIKTDEEQPNPKAIRKAMKDVVRNCIYGVDKNPLAVELCKIALWLEAYNPGEPLNFLDHHIKCGDAIVGLAHRDELKNGIPTAAFKALSGDDPIIAKTFRDKNIKERKEQIARTLQLRAEFDKATENSIIEAMEAYRLFHLLPESTPDEIENKAKAYKNVNNGKAFARLKEVADTKLAQFFIPKINENRDVIMTDADFQLVLNGYQGWQDRKLAKATAVALKHRFFHWFIEFPDVISSGGFDCVLGNPPFLGGQKITGHYGEDFLESIKYQFEPIGAVDLVTYFFRRIFKIIKIGGFQSLISTKTIAQGKAREGGLDFIVGQGGSINHAIRGVKWPGDAAVDVVIVTITKQYWKKKFFLDNKEVEVITPYLDDALEIGNPFPLKLNSKKSFQGSILIGKGFVIDNKEAHVLVSIDPRNKEVLFPYLSGDDINNDPEQKPSRWVINFFDWPEKKASTYPDCFDIVERLVKPERQRWKLDQNGDEIEGTYALRTPLPQKWWIYGEKRPLLYDTISKLDQVIAINRYTKYLALDFQPNNIVFSDSIVVLALNSLQNFAILSSVVHDLWAWKYSSTMGSSTLRYSPSKAFETLPFPTGILDKLETIAYNFNKARKSLMSILDIGLTELYNLFHDPTLQSAEIHAEILRLRELHLLLDRAVLESYGWDDIDLNHSFYELEYLPDNDRLRFTVSKEARKEILKRLLILNNEHYEQEIKQGVHKHVDVKEFYKIKNKEVPMEINSLYSKVRNLNTTIIADETWNQIERGKSQIELNFTSNKNIIMKEFGLNDGIYSISDTAAITTFSPDKVRRWFKELAAANYEGVSDFDITDIERSRISFHGLIELVVIGTLREYCSLPKILKARNELGKMTGKVYPFATNDVSKGLKVTGRTLQFILLNGDIIDLDGTSQLNVSFITLFFKDIEFVNDVAQRIIPKKGKKRIVIDPKVGGGRPSMMNFPGIQVNTVVKFYDGPNSIPGLIENYGITKEDIEAAVSYMS